MSPWVENYIKPQRFGYSALAVWLLACVWQTISFIMAGLIGTAAGGNTGAIIFSVLSVVGGIICISGIVIGSIALKRDTKKVAAWISVIVHCGVLLFTGVLVVAGFIVRF